MEQFIHEGKVARFFSSMLYYGDEYIGEFKGAKEAKEYLESLSMTEELRESLGVTRKELTETSIALALNESGEVRATTSAVANFKTLVNEKHFYPSNTLLKLREEYNPSNVNGKIDYVLQDGSTVLIDTETNAALNTILDLKESAELLIFMTANPTNFMKCVDELLEDN